MTQVGFVVSHIGTSIVEGRTQQILDVLMFSNHSINLTVLRALSESPKVISPLVKIISSRQRFALWLTLFLHGQVHAVSPAEAVLIGVFAAAGGQGGIHNVVFFGHLSRGLKHFIVQSQPAVAPVNGSFRKTVVHQSLINNPLQGCPAVGPVPLLTRLLKRCNPAARL